MECSLLTVRGFNEKIKPVFYVMISLHCKYDYNKLNPQNIYVWIYQSHPTDMIPTWFSLVSY